MNSHFVLITTTVILFAGCDRQSADGDTAKDSEIAAQKQAEQAASEKIRQIEDRLDAADKEKAAEREAELARVKAELEQVKRDKELAAERIRDLQVDAAKPAPVAAAPVRDTDLRNPAIHADLRRTIEDEEDREPVHRAQFVPETQRVSSIESFYEPLDPYGDWIQTDDYGYVFQPAVASRRDWRPYTDGRWVHSRHGWTWHSNEDFGWATYHYGRWTRIVGAGWVWVPGREWGPGWVSWRRGADHCGWAPLPPTSRTRLSFTATVDRDYDIGPAAYVFVALTNFGARSYAPVVERPDQNVTIINKTVNITNITYDNTTNKTEVYNGGPSYTLMRARSKQPVEHVEMSFAPRNAAAERKKISNVRQGDTLQVAAAPAATAVAAPPRVKQRLNKTKEDKGWEGVDPAQKRIVKQNIAATSTERPKKRRPAGSAEKPVIVDPAVRPGVVAPTPPKPAVQVPPTPEAPAQPAVVNQPRKPDPDSTKPRRAAELPPKPGKPAELQKPVAEPPDRKPLPERTAPQLAPDVAPRVDPPDEPEAPREPKSRKVRAPGEPGAQQPIRAVPPQSDSPLASVKPKGAKPPTPPEAPGSPDVEPPARIKQPVEAPARVRPPNPEDSATDPARNRPGKPKRDDAPPSEKRAPMPPVKQPAAWIEPAPVRKEAQPQIAPEIVRSAPASVARPAVPDAQRGREKAGRQQVAPPAGQRAPQSQPPDEESEKKKKKKEGRE